MQIEQLKKANELYQKIEALTKKELSIKEAKSWMNVAIGLELQIKIENGSICLEIPKELGDVIYNLVRTYIDKKLIEAKREFEEL